MTHSLHVSLNQHIISPLSYYFAQFIAQQSEQDIDSLVCQTAALVSECNQQGDVCINLKDYANTVIFEYSENDQLVGVLLPKLDDWIKEISQFSSVSMNFAMKPLIIDGHHLYLGKLWHFEDAIVQHISQRLNQPKDINEISLKHGLTHLFKDNNSSNIDWQKVAASIVVTQSFSVISGGPGTGKTTTLIKIIALLLDQNPTLKIQLCAPTGKAAIRMLEAINSRKNELGLEQSIIDKMPNDAKTIHRLLAYKQGQFSFNKNSPLMLDCLIIDEASMIDFELMYHVMNALPKQCKIILLGDKDQLSSVDAGHVFSDICGRGSHVGYSKEQAELLSRLNDIDELDVLNNSGPIANAIALLKTSYRFTKDSGIGRLARFVNNGDGAAALDLLHSKTTDLSFIPVDNDELPKQAIDKILKHYERVVSAQTVEQAINEFSQFQVLCAVHNGSFGVNALNELVNQRLFLRHKTNTIQEFNGQPILITQNDYENKLFNGDIGIMWKADDQFFVYFQQIDGSLKSYPLVSLCYYETAWAITVHKSQGSEYDDVLLVLPNLNEVSLVKRELIYTGITRAKEYFSLCCYENTLIKSCLHKTQRSSGLAKKLGW